MAPKRSIFFDDWRDCLHAHYEYVVRTGDSITEPTLRYVIQHAGLSDDEVNAIRAEALSGSLDEADRPAAWDESGRIVEDPVAEWGGAEGGEPGEMGRVLENLPSEDALLEDLPLEDELLEELRSEDAPSDDAPPDDPATFRPSQLSLF